MSEWSEGPSETAKKAIPCLSLASRSSLAGMQAMPTSHTCLCLVLLMHEAAAPALCTHAQTRRHTCAVHAMPHHHHHDCMSGPRPWSLNLVSVNARTVVQARPCMPAISNLTRLAWEDMQPRGAPTSLLPASGPSLLSESAMHQLQLHMHSTRAQQGFEKPSTAGSSLFSQGTVRDVDGWHGSPTCGSWRSCGEQK